MKRTWLLFILSSLLPLLCIASPPAFKLETIGPCNNPEVSDEMKKALQPQGFRVSADSGVLCEVWLRAVIPMKAGVTGTDYSNIPDSTFAGVIIYSLKAADYRGQNLPPGIYTMRYQTMPSDGNHMGVSPTMDYFLLSPIAADKNPDATIEYMDLVNLSRKASKTNHPTPVYLSTPTAGGKPDFRDAGSGQWILEMKTNAQPAGGSAIDLPIAIVLIGKSEAG